MGSAVKSTPALNIAVSNAFRGAIFAINPALHRYVSRWGVPKNLRQTSLICRRLCAVDGIIDLEYRS